MTRPASCTACPLAAAPPGNHLQAVRRTIAGDRWSGRLGRASLCCRRCTSSGNHRRTSRTALCPNRCRAGLGASPDSRLAEEARRRTASRPARSRPGTTQWCDIADADHFRSCIRQIRSMRHTAECTRCRLPVVRRDTGRPRNPRWRQCRRCPHRRSSQFRPRLRLSRQPQPQPRRHSGIRVHSSRRSTC